MSELASLATAWMDDLWDAEAGLLWDPIGGRHLVPQNGWYVLGLLMRGDPGDAERVEQVVSSLVATQYHQPGTPWHGTYRRFLETPDPTEGARIWEDYDPNWRQFIGTAFTLALRMHGDAVPDAVAEQMTRSVELAVESEPPERVPPWYSNIALKKAWLDVEWGRRDQGEAFAEQVVELFDQHGTFQEYNSPTYYGVDFYALGLWRSHSSSPKLRAWGERLERELWEDVACFYHAGLRNMAAPYTRAYGLDMTTYAAQLGLWVWAALGRQIAPFPDVTRPFEHAHDLCFGPCVSALGSRIPEGVTEDFRVFRGERLVTRTISSFPSRQATAWLAPDVMIGAETNDLDFGDWDQFVPAAVHWRAPDGSIAWIRLVQKGPAGASAEPGLLRVAGGESTFLVHAPDWRGPLDAGRTSLPGLSAELSVSAGESVLAVTPR
jgi:hypothetical protein